MESIKFPCYSKVLDETLLNERELKLTKFILYGDPVAVNEYFSRPLVADVTGAMEHERSLAAKALLIRNQQAEPKSSLLETVIDLVIFSAIGYKIGDAIGGAFFGKEDK